MRSKTLLGGLLVTLTVMGLIGRVEAGDDGHDGYEGQWHEKHDRLAGRTFFIRGKYLFVNAAVVAPEVLQAGDTFLNCYTFEEDGIADTLDSGTRVDPLLPDPLSAVPGTWFQHTEGRVIQYAAYGEAAGLLLVQNGTVRQAITSANRGSRPTRL